MKLFVKITCIALLTLSFASCKKESTTSTPVKMGAKIDGKAWDSSVRATTLQNNIFIITGTSATLEVIAITVNGSSTGTYTLSALPLLTQCGATYTASVLGGASEVYASVTGKVVLTKVDKTAKLISGTFEFTVANSQLASKSITSGQFNDLQYTEY